MQGWTPDFLPKLAQDAVRAGWIDEILPVRGSDALRLARELAQREGILTGITGGATFAGALQIAARAPRGANILCMLPDAGERYLRTPLFEDIAAEMTGEEIGISRSTPSCRFDVRPRAMPSPSHAAAPAQLAPEAAAFVDKVTNDVEEPVVMFAYEWCEKYSSAIATSAGAPRRLTLSMTEGFSSCWPRTEYRRSRGATSTRIHSCPSGCSYDEAT